jgi:hypothetical protein
MAQPHPPQGNQQQATERPLKVFAEQYVDGQPLPIGVVIDPVRTDGQGETQPIFIDGQARVLLPSGWVVIHLTDWVISNRYTGAAREVIAAEEYSERFGPGGGPPLA